MAKTAAGMGFDTYSNHVVPCADEGGNMKKRISNREGFTWDARLAERI